MKQWVEHVRVSWQTTDAAAPTLEVALGNGTPAVMTPELAEKLCNDIELHLGHIRRFNEQREAATPR